jgi:hypothetical protein
MRVSRACTAPVPSGSARNRAIRAFSDRYVPRYGPSADGARHIRAWAAAHAVAKSLWWPQSLQTGSPSMRRTSPRWRRG